MIDPKTISRHPRTTLFKTCSKTYKKWLIYPTIAVLIALVLKILRNPYRNHPQILFFIFLEDGYNFQLNREDDLIRLLGLPRGSELYGI